MRPGRLAVKLRQTVVKFDMSHAVVVPKNTIRLGRDEKRDVYHSPGNPVYSRRPPSKNLTPSNLDKFEFFARKERKVSSEASLLHHKVISRFSESQTRLIMAQAINFFFSVAPKRDRSSRKTILQRLKEYFRFFE